jgi:hypothetical protein
MDLALLDVAVPKRLWLDLVADGLLRDDAPIPD